MADERELTATERIWVDVVMEAADEYASGAADDAFGYERGRGHGSAATTTRPELLSRVEVLVRELGDVMAERDDSKSRAEKAEAEVRDHAEWAKEFTTTDEHGKMWLDMIRERDDALRKVEVLEARLATMSKGLNELFAAFWQTPMSEKRLTLAVAALRDSVRAEVSEAITARMKQPTEGKP